MRRLVLVALLFAAPSWARRHRPHRPAGPPPARSEDDPRKKGDHKAFAKATLSFAAPADLSAIDPALPVHIELRVSGYALGPLQPLLDIREREREAALRRALRVLPTKPGEPALLSAWRAWALSGKRLPVLSEGGEDG